MLQQSGQSTLSGLCQRYMWALNKHFLWRDRHLRNSICKLACERLAADASTNNSTDCLVSCSQLPFGKAHQIKDECFGVPSSPISSALAHQACLL